MASSKNYNFFALAVKKSLEKGEQRLMHECLTILASEPESLPLEEFDSRDAPLGTMGRLGGNAHVEEEDGKDIERHSLGAGLTAPKLVHSQPHSLSPRVSRQAATTSSSLDLGLQTLADVVRARLRQSLRAWVTHTRQHRLQDLHSSVLQALQTATNINIEKSISPARQHDAGAQAAMASSSAASPPAVKEAHGHYAEPTSQHPAGDELQPGASLSGSRYSGDSLRLRSKERNVFTKEKLHGPGHPEVVRALLDLASHHGECGNVEEQRTVMHRALEVQERHLHGSHLQSHVDGFEAEAKRASTLSTQSKAVSEICGQENRRISAVMDLLQGSGKSDSRVREASSDRVVEELYTDRARIDEVIKLASKLLESGMLTAAAPRKAPILKSSLLLRLAERFHTAAMRDALQHWWRRCSLQRAVQELAIPQHSSHKTASEVDATSGLQLEEGAAGSVEDQVECQRLRAELQKMEAKLTEYAAKAAPETLHVQNSTTHGAEEAALARENARLREELQAMQKANKHDMIVEQPMSSQHSQQSRRSSSSHDTITAKPGHVVCRIVAAHGLRERYSGTGLHDVADPFVVARVGAVQFHTKSANDKINPLWNSVPFDFPVNLASKNENHLFLKVLDHHMFHMGHSLGEVDLELSALEPGKLVKQRTHLHNGNGAELEFEVCFAPLEGQHVHVADEIISKELAATPDGFVAVRVLAAQGIHNPLSGSIDAEAIHPFTVVRLGKSEFRTKLATSSTNPIWEQDQPFLFHHVDVHDVRQRTLHLLVCNHSYLHENRCIGSADVHLPDLEVDKMLRIRKPLHGAEGGELQVEVCFSPKGQHASSGTQGLSAAGLATLSVPLSHTTPTASAEQKGSPTHGVETANTELETSQLPSEGAVNDILASLGEDDAKIDKADSDEDEMSEAPVSDEELANMLP